MSSKNPRSSWLCGKYVKELNQLEAKYDRVNALYKKAFSILKDNRRTFAKLENKINEYKFKYNEYKDKYETEVRNNEAWQAARPIRGTSRGASQGRGASRGSSKGRGASRGSSKGRAAPPHAEDGWGGEP